MRTLEDLKNHCEDKKQTHCFAVTGSIIEAHFVSSDGSASTARRTLKSTAKTQQRSLDEVTSICIPLKMLSFLFFIPYR